MATSTDWLDDLKVGGTVVLARVDGSLLTLGTVGELSRRMVTVDGQRFSRSSGVGWGAPQVWLLEPTAAHLAEVTAQADLAATRTSLETSLRALG